MPWAAEVYIEPTALETIRVEFRAGWSPSIRDSCFHAQAFHVEQHPPEMLRQTSSTAGDCIPVPEAPPTLLLAAGAILLALIARPRVVPARESTGASRAGFCRGPGAGQSRRETNAPRSRARVSRPRS